MAFITNWIEDKATGYLRTGIQAGGTLAGNAVGGVGSLVESAGRSAGNGVSGGIGSVGNYINGYGQNVQRSMSADGPVLGGTKKTAVKPPAAPKAVSSAGGAKKPLPSSGGAQKALSTAGGGGTVKAQQTPSQRAQKPATPGSKLVGSRPGTTGKTTRPVASSNSARSATNATRPVSNTPGAGKVSVSAASRPRPGTNSKYPNRTAPASSSKQNSSDILGIGQSFGDLNKASKPNSGQMGKGSSGPPQKPSGGDILGIGADFGTLGKTK